MDSVAHHLTFDVEEYFHVSAFEPHVPRSSWDRWPRRLDQVMPRILDLLAEQGVTATFFTLGVVAEESPEIVREIARAGHEVASHGWDHRRITDLDPASFRQQVRDSRALLEDLAGTRVLGFRAPSFSIVPGREWALDILVEEGYRYDSSLYPVRRRGYGYPGGARVAHQLDRPGGTLVEVPPTTLRVGGMNLPAGGGGTFRQLPYHLTWRAFARHGARRESGTFYLHPWELDPDQPRVPDLPWVTRLRHYRGITRTEDRLRRLLGDFRFGSVEDSLRSSGLL
jgi:polysaccharide deacetylase family protein (PEP-CTERM system associated)